MKKILLGIAAALVLAACSENKQQETTEAVDTASVVTDLMMSRRSIRAYKDSVISRETLDEILACGINAPNGMNRQSYELRVIDSPALIDSITEAVVKDNPAIAERKGFKNIFVNAPCVICIAYDTQYDMAQIDCGLLGENIILAAWAVPHDGYWTLLRPSLSLTAWHSLRATTFSTVSLWATPMKRPKPNRGEMT